ncbi:MAG TPA: hypothetical protein VN861_08800 [Candidatus Acidoferrales bacterium]|nr:hypothetical protein [Candidatus Acidoferrales bacterium]
MDRRFEDHSRSLYKKTVNSDMATYTYEMARGSEPWTQVTEGKQSRQK